MDNIGLYLNKPEALFRGEVVAGIQDFNPVAYRPELGKEIPSNHDLDFAIVRNNLIKYPHQEYSTELLRDFMGEYMASPARSIKYDLWDSVLHNLK